MEKKPYEILRNFRDALLAAPKGFAEATERELRSANLKYHEKLLEFFRGELRRVLDSEYSSEREAVVAPGGILVKVRPSACCADLTFGIAGRLRVDYSSGGPFFSEAVFGAKPVALPMEKRRYKESPSRQPAWNAMRKVSADPEFLKNVGKFVSGERDEMALSAAEWKVCSRFLAFLRETDEDVELLKEGKNYERKGNARL